MDLLFCRQQKRVHNLMDHPVQISGQVCSRQVVEITFRAKLRDDDKDKCATSSAN